MEEKDTRQSHINAPPRNARLLFEIIVIALKIGSFTFGAGYAMFPLMRAEYSVKRNWFSEEDLLDVLAVGQSLPGMISVNAASLIGYRLYGLAGAAVSVFFLILPTVILLPVLSIFYVKFMADPYVGAALRGIGAGVVALLAHTAWRLIGPALKDAFGWVVAGIAFALFFAFPGLVLWIILGGLAAGIVRSLVRNGKTSKNGGAA